MACKRGRAGGAAMGGRGDSGVVVCPSVAVSRQGLRVGSVLFGFNAPFVLSFVSVCVVVFVADWLSNRWLQQHVFCINGYFGILRPGSWPMLVTHSMGHVSLKHLTNNMSLLLLLGPMLEERHGTVPLLLMSAVTSAVTGLVSVVVLRVGLLGASSIVFLFIMLSSFGSAAPHGTTAVPLTSVLVALLYLGNEVYMGLFQDQVSQFAHIFGGVCGALFGFAATSARLHSTWLGQAMRRHRPQRSPR